MPFVLPLISLALAVLAQVAFRDPKAGRWRWGPLRLAALAVLSAGAAYLSARFAGKNDALPLDEGLLIGALITAVMAGRPTRMGAASLVASLAAGVAGSSAIHLLPTPSQWDAQLGLMCGVGLGALALGAESATVTAVTAVVVAAADMLGARHSAAPAAPFFGSLIGVCATVGGILAGWLGGRLAFARPLVAGVIVLLGGLFASQSVPEKHLLTTLAIGVAAGIAIDWLLSVADADGVRIGLATVIGIGVATLAFGLERGVGMAAALAAASGILVATGNRPGVLTLGPLLGLVMFRVLSEARPSASHALDIGQHYGLLGLTLGAIVPLLPTDWFAVAQSPIATGDGTNHPSATEAKEGGGGKRGPSLRSYLAAFWMTALGPAFGAVLWGVAALGFPALVTLMFGEKGVIGFVVGLGFSGVCQALRKGTDLLPLALAGGMASVTILSVDWMTGPADMTRDEKVKAFGMASAALIVVGGLLALVSRGRKMEVAN